MSRKEFSIAVPASTANLGPGFDSIGLALDLHLNIHVSPADSWQLIYKTAEYAHLSGVEDNLILQAAERTAAAFSKELPPAKLEIETDIPLGRGLGSSASAIAAGIELANRLLGLHMSNQQKVQIGTEMEGHPDNISASLLGGLTISYYDEKQIETVHVEQVDIGVVLLIPQEIFLTEESRSLLPEQLQHADSIRGSAAGNVLSAAMARGDWEKAGKLMSKDTFHQPYRQHRFPDFKEIGEACRKLSAYGCAISGAGPSLFIAVSAGDQQRIAEALSQLFPHYESMAIKPAIIGTKSYETVA
ncbi:homoserine kinase [Planococcus sp. CP5-4]|uniref:homoserine kinase n=1 Tax=unclassified Planococcus (in: firmicutes) TaxID=2662419 RepID=UPI001C22B10B|nr:MULTISPECIES: homoserine kinase [unclassified Planococcus (in: firmicutes)]MBU9673615.1 homoserine kinase [Planococcus sp. CP5-4_YE]MBV0907905.1 homoserine kinase [Planococcus sp. CP5-4_UN]MBW6063072.1 homoserine kinase [Planococcus sp. CP5-4]